MEAAEPPQMQEMQSVMVSTWVHVQTRSMLDVVIEDTIYVHCQSAANTLPMSSAPRSHRALDYKTKSARKVMKVSCKLQNHLQVQVTKVTYQLQFPKWQLEMCLKEHFLFIEACCGSALLSSCVARSGFDV